MSFPRFSLSSFVTLFSFQGTIFILILNSNKFACSSLFLRRRRVHRYARLRKNAKCAWNCLNWWRWGESNSWPPACKAGALPAELHPQILVDTSLLTNITSLVIFVCSRILQPTVGIIFAYVPPCYGNFVAYRSASLHDFTPARSYDVSHCYAMLVVGLSGLEPPTSRLSGVRSNRLSYRPMQGFYWVQFPFPTYINILCFKCSCFNMYIQR